MNRRCNYDKDMLLEAQRRVRIELAKRSPIPATVDVTNIISLVEADHIASSKKMPTDYSSNDLLRIDVLIANSLAHKSFPIVCVHDEFKCHANNMNHLRCHYVDIFAELADSNLLEDILTQVNQEPTGIPKVFSNLSTQIRQSNYALS